MLYGELRFLAICSSVAHGILAVGLFWSIGSIGNSPADRLMDRIFPPWVWPGAFALVAVFAGLTTFGRARYMRWAFYMGSLLMAIWALATFAAWWVTGIPQPSAPWLLYVAILKFMMARYVLARQRLALLAGRVVELGEEVIRESGREPSVPHGAE